MAFEMRCYRRVINVGWQQKSTTEETGKREGNKKNIIQRIRERTFNLFIHIYRTESSRLVKEVVFGEIEGKTTRGRPRK